jgi:hypothetical protein
MRNKATGLYEVRRFYNLTNQEIVGVGETQEAAKEDFKKKLAKYREQPVVPTGEYLHSPGYGVVNVDGRTRYRYSDERKAQVVARPDLAEHIKQLAASEKK